MDPQVSLVLLDPGVLTEALVLQDRLDLLEVEDQWVLRVSQGPPETQDKQDQQGQQDL